MPQNSSKSYPAAECPRITRQTYMACQATTAAVLRRANIAGTRCVGVRQESTHSRGGRAGNNHRHGSLQGTHEHEKHRVCFNHDRSTRPLITGGESSSSPTLRSPTATLRPTSVKTTEGAHPHLTSRPPPNTSKLAQRLPRSCQRSARRQAPVCEWGSRSCTRAWAPVPVGRSKKQKQKQNDAGKTV